jgi:hypothetical protein
MNSFSPEGRQIKPLPSSELSNGFPSNLEKMQEGGKKEGNL